MKPDKLNIYAMDLFLYVFLCYILQLPVMRVYEDGTYIYMLRLTYVDYVNLMLCVCVYIGNLWCYQWTTTHIVMKLIN